MRSFSNARRTLHDRLAGGLRCDATEIGRIDFLLNGITDDRARLEDLGLLNVDLQLGIGNGINHLEHRPRLELAVLRTDLNL
jgi:hypothetical protein